MQKAKIPLLILSILVIVYFVYRYLKNTSTAIEGGSTAATVASKNGVLEKEKDKTILDKIVEVVVPPAPKYTNKLGLTYEGQSLYGKYNGTNGTVSPNIGYLMDGTLIGLFNAEYRDGEYKKLELPDTGVVLSSYIGMFVVDNVSQKVFAQKTGVNLFDYFQAIGFLESGIMVFQRIVNQGQETEYSYYGT